MSAEHLSLIQPLSGEPLGPGDTALDRLVRLAVAALDVPIALISTLSDEQQIVRSGVGLPEPWRSARVLPPSHAICRHMIAVGAPLSVEDILHHPVLASHSGVREFAIRSYLGIPLRSSSQRLFGCFCVADHVAREWSAAQLSALQDLAELASAEFELQDSASELRRIEASLRENQERARIIAEAAADVIISLDASYRVLFVNHAVEQVFGYTPEEIVGQPITMLIDSDQRPAPEELRRYLTSGAQGRDLTWLHRSGRPVEVELSLGEYIKNGEPLFTGVIRDHTERRSAELALLESQSRLELLNTIAIGMSAGLSVKQVVERSLKRLSSYFSGYRVSYALIDASDRYVLFQAIDPSAARPARVPPLDLDSAPEYVELLRRDAALIVNDAAAELPDGGLRAAFADAAIGALLSVPMRIASRATHSPEHLLAALTLDTLGPHSWSSHEITTLREVAKYIAITLNDAYARQEHRRAEEALLRSEATTQALLNAIPDPILRLDRAGILLDCKIPKDDQTFALPEDMLGRRADEFLPPPVAQQLQQSIERALADGEMQLFEYQLALTGGAGMGDFEARVVPSGASEVMMIVRDITERKRLETQFLQIQKIESVGQLAGGIAHDFNNLLTAIIGYSELAMMSLPGDAEALGDVEEIRRAADRAAGLTRHLLSFARRQVMELRVVKLNDLIIDLYKLLRRLIGEDIELIMLPSASPAWVKVDAGQIEQVLVNLAVNARDAMPEGGKLTIAIANRQFDADVTRRYVGASAGEYVMLSVSDTGIGMDEHVRAHLFEPFFTTKEKGRGTGLGLATCYGIVKQHGGWIDVASAAGQGTAIDIYLPRVRLDPSATHAYYDEAQGLPRGNEIILLVEDEPAVRVLAARVLRAQGYVVLEAENGDEALSLARQRGRAALHLLLTDVVMPRMSGKALAERLTAEMPDLKVLFTSGYTNDTMVYQGAVDSGMAFLQKPFTPPLLARKVREVLDS
jgi:PAS domain S-box-containing protein